MEDAYGIGMEIDKDVDNLNESSNAYDYSWEDLDDNVWNQLAEDA